jgi:hypothetical protein
MDVAHALPWRTEVVFDRGSEFQAELSAMLKNDCGIAKKVTVVRDPQANSMAEHVHRVTHQLIHMMGVKGKFDLDDEFGWNGILSTVRQAVRSTRHTTQQAKPAQSVFGSDAILNVAFWANWQCMKECKLQHIVQNDKKENATRIPHQCTVGDHVMV